MSNINPSTTDLEDIISERAAQLNALLICISGGGFESFNGLNDVLKNNVLWACQVLAEDIQLHINNEDEHLQEAENGN